jgi:hypothetical protein
MQLPAYIQNIAKGIMKSGTVDKSTAIEYAIGVCKNWAAGKGNVSPEVRAAAAKAIAEWEADKAEAHASSKSLSATTLAMIDLAVVRTAAGAAKYKTPIGTTIGSARNSQAATAQKNKKAVAAYYKLVVQKAAAMRAALSKMDINQLLQTSQVAFSFKSSDSRVVALRNAAVAEIRKRGVTPSKGGYLGMSSPEVTNEIDLVHHVATAAGVAHFHLPIGSPIGGGGVVAITHDKLMQHDSAEVKKTYGMAIKQFGHQHETTKALAKVVALQHVASKKPAPVKAVEKVQTPEERALGTDLPTLKKAYGESIKKNGYQHPTTKLLAKHVAVKSMAAKKAGTTTEVKKAAPSPKAYVPAKGEETVLDPSGKPIGYFSKDMSGSLTPVKDLQGNKVGSAMTFLDAQKALGAKVGVPLGVHDHPIKNVPKPVVAKDDPRAHILRSAEPSPAEKQSLYVYTGSGHKPINIVASGSKYAGTSAEQHANYKSHVMLLQNVISKSVVQEPITVFRYTGGAHINEQFGSVGSKIGKSFTTKRFTSTSAIKGKTKGFGNVEFVYHLKPGTQAFDINDGGYGIDYEHEVLVNRGLKFKVVNDTLVGGTRQITVESV